MDNLTMPPQPPPGLPPYVQTFADKDAEHLKILSICYYVQAGLTALGACVPVIHVAMGIAMLTDSFPSSGASSADRDAMHAMGGMFVVFGSIAIVLGWAFAVCNFLVARRIAKRKSRILCYVVAGLNCLSIPIGTTLGVFTFIVMGRPSIADSFARNEEE